MTNQPATCLYCDRSDQEVPLVSLRYQGQDLWICSQHLPILIHKPNLLQDKLPGSANLAAAEHED